MEHGDGGGGVVGCSWFVLACAMVMCDWFLVVVYFLYTWVGLFFGSFFNGIGILGPV